MTMQTALVSSYPACDFCGEEAHFDGKTTLSVWAFMCDYDFQVYGKGLGIAIGQRLITLDDTSENVPYAGEA